MKSGLEHVFNILGTNGLSGSWLPPFYKMEYVGPTVLPTLLFHVFLFFFFFFFFYYLLFEKKKNRKMKDSKMKDTERLESSSDSLKNPP